jgi:hypothetical protein
LEQAGISYADTTGWVNIFADEPIVLIGAQGAVKSPKPSGPASMTRLNGRSAGRIIRALSELAAPVGVSELAKMAGVAPGTVSKTLLTLLADSAVERDRAGRVTGVNRRQLLSRWTVDYQVLKSNGTPAYFVAPRGIDAMMAKATTRSDLVVTGARSGSAWLPEGTAPIIPVTQLVLYVANVEDAGTELQLVSVDAPSANVILLTPQDLTILDYPARRDGVAVAPLSVTLADLLTLPGRYPRQAEALMDALAETDPAWRP